MNINHKLTQRDEVHLHQTFLSGAEEFCVIHAPEILEVNVEMVMAVACFESKCF